MMIEQAFFITVWGMGGVFAVLCAVVAGSFDLAHVPSRSLHGLLLRGVAHLAQEWGAYCYRFYLHHRGVLLALVRCC